MVRSGLIALVVLVAVSSAGAQSGRVLTPAYIPEPGVRTVDEWRAAVDLSWPERPEPDSMLAQFDWYWNIVSEWYGAFQHLEVDWIGRRARRKEILEGPSLGRFVGIMNHMALALRESHTRAIHRHVNDSTRLEHGVPMMAIGPWRDGGHFGACLTPLQNQSLLVYNVADEHPLGLSPGDVVTGFDGVPWSSIYPVLLEAELPITGGWWGSSPSAFRHSLLGSAGRNWHLFRSVDVIKHGAEGAISIDLAPLADRTTVPALKCLEQLPIAGVPLPDGEAFGDNLDVATWGVVDGTDVGYIYVHSWTGQVTHQFAEAVRTLMFDHETSGLIIDFRFNLGGSWRASNAGLQMLFNERVATTGLAIRGDQKDRFAMEEASGFGPQTMLIPGEAGSFYDRPIAVLTGPGAYSSGDQVALRMRFHPSARIFGRPTAGAFSSVMSAFPPDEGEWYGGLALLNTYLVADPDRYLTHTELPVDTYVWLEPDDVADGRDTVVETALDWISDENARIQSALDADAEKPIDGFKLSVFPNPAHTRGFVSIESPDNHEIEWTLYDAAGRALRTRTWTSSGGSSTLDLSYDGLPPGIYFHRFDSAFGTRVVPVTVLRSG